MVTQSWLYDAILYIYTLSLLFYFSDFIGSNQSAKRMGTGLLVFVWVLQTLFLANTLYQHQGDDLITMLEAMFLLSWFLVMVSLIVNHFIRIEPFVFFINIVGFGILALNLFGGSGVSSESYNYEHMTSELLFVHISLAVGSYAAFAVGAVLSGMYLFIHRRLKEKQWTAQMKRFPSLEKMDRYAYLAVIAGVPLLMLALSLGIVWIIMQGDLEHLYDPKVVNSLFILAAYTFYFIQRLSLKAPGYRIAIWNLTAFAVVLANFLVTNLFSGFHRWIWM